MVERRRVWHYITALGLHAHADDFGRGTISPPLDSTHDRQRRAWHDITSLGQHAQSAMSGVVCHQRPWTSLHSRPVLSVVCHHRPWTTNTVEQHQAWHAITSYKQYIRSNNVRHGITSLPLESKHDRTTSGVKCHHHFGLHTRSNDVRHGMPSLPLGSTNG